MIVCTACGKENAENFNFCLDCGNDLRRSPTGPGVAMPAAAAAAPIPLSTSPAAAPIPLVPAPAPAPIPLVPASDAATPGPGAPIPLVAGAAAGRACPSCGAAVPPGFSFCGACGTRLSVEENVPKGGTMFMHVAPATAEKPKAKLVTIRPDGGEGMTFTLKADETLAGRSQGVVLFTEDAFVSPKHCRFFYKDDRLHVEDLGSLNGVFKKVRGEAELTPGDHVRMGRQLLRLEPMTGGAREQPDGTKVWGSPDPGYRARLLQLLEGGGVGEVFPLKSGDNLIGREQGDITFPTDGFVSGRHANVNVEGDKAKIRDLGSSNGTFLRIGAAVSVEHGDFLLIGNQLLRVDVR